MSYRTIEWTAYTRLSCYSCTPADVIIVLKDDDEADTNPISKIAPRDCSLEGAPPEITEETNFEWHHIQGQLILAQTIKNNCGASYYRYQLVYDDAQLTSGSNLLSDDISCVVCKGGLTTYIEDVAGDDIKVEELTPGTFTLTNQHGCQYEFGISTGGCPITQTAHGFILPMQGV